MHQDQCGFRSLVNEWDTLKCIVGAHADDIMMIHLYTFLCLRLNKYFVMEFKFIKMIALKKMISFVIFYLLMDITTLSSPCIDPP